MTLALSGNLLIALASSAQALRWLLAERERLEGLRDAATTRTDRLTLRRRAIRAQSDWTLWTAIATGAWLLVAAELL